MGALNIPRQQWPEEEAELVGVHTPSLAVLGVMTSGRKWMSGLVSSLRSIFISSMCMYVVCSCLYPDMYRPAHEGPLSSSIALRSLTEPETHYESLASWSEDSQGLLLSASRHWSYRCAQSGSSL